MANLPNDSCKRDCCPGSDPRLNQAIRCKSSKSNEGCPVIDESGTVCGETDSLSIFQEFRKIYEDCLEKLEGSPDGNEILKKLAPFKKIVDDLWEQNTMLVEAVEELEQEASCQVTNLQNKLDKSCQKELHCILKTKEREVQSLTKEICEKNELLAKHRCRIEQLEQDFKSKRQQCKTLIKRLKAALANKESRKSCKDSNNGVEENEEEEDDDDDQDDAEYDDCNCDVTALEKLLNEYVAKLEAERQMSLQKAQFAERQVHMMTSERKKLLIDRSDIGNRLQNLAAENERLIKEKVQHKVEYDSEKGELLKMVESLKLEKTDLLNKIDGLHENIHDLNSTFKETRWALTTEVAEKHDQVQELKRSVYNLEEQLRQADKQIQFKDDVVKELRKEVKTLRKSGRQDLYDVTQQVRKKKSSKNAQEASTTTFRYGSEKSYGMNCSSPCQDGPDSGFFSAATLTPEKDQDKESTACENVKLRSELECVKNSLKMRTKDLRVQQEWTRDLEEELDRTRMDLCTLQEKFERQERRQKSMTINSVSDPGVSWKYGTLYCAVNKVEATLRNLSEKHSCGLSECKTVIEEEMEKILSVKNDLKIMEAGKTKSKCGGGSSSSNQTVQFGPCEVFHSMPSVEASGCNMIHLNDVETFRERALTGAATLEEMKEQIDIIERTVRKHLNEFSCECDKTTLTSCEEKLEALRCEFDEVSDQLCSIIQKFNSNLEDSYGNDKSSTTCYDLMKPREHRSMNTEECTTEEDVSKLMGDSERLRQEIWDQENEVEKLQDLYRQLEEEIAHKRQELAQHNRDVETRMCEIVRLKDVMTEVGQKLRGNTCAETHTSRSTTSQNNSSNLRGLFCAIREFRSILEETRNEMDESSNVQEENDKLRRKIACMEKYIHNKEETLKVLQDTVKLKESQMEEVKQKMECSENETCKLAQDMEEKCRLISNLQDALRKSKQFEVNVRSVQVEALEFKVCDLNNRLKKSEKEITAKEKTLENLHGQVLILSSKNISLSRELNVIEPRLKSMYKTCHLFEKMVNDLQSELNDRECEVDGLCGKIKELENELDSEFKKCETRALEDSKCIEDLSVAVKDFQQELFMARENYNITIAETEGKLMHERQIYQQRECELNQEICRLQKDINDLRSQLEGNSEEDSNSAKISDLECLLKEAESRHAMYDKKIAELQNKLELTMLEHAEERKNILEKLCEQKKENVKNKTLITELNENVKQKLMSEEMLREQMNRVAEDSDLLRNENSELRAEVEVRKKIMCAMERNENINLSEMEEMICQLKMQKADVKSRCCNLRAELDRELKVKRVLECRVEDLSGMLQSKLGEFDEIVRNYKCTSSKLQQTLSKIKLAEETSTSIENSLREEVESGQLDECECLKRIIDMKTAENAKLFSRLLVSQVEMESLQTEYFASQANKDCLISRLRFEVNNFEKNYEDLQDKYCSLEEENRRIQGELECFANSTTSMQAEFREKQKEMCAKLRTALCEKNELINSVDKLQKQLEQICLDNVNKDEMNRELLEECSRLKSNSEANDTYMKNKTDKVIYNLRKEVKNLQCELCSVRENYNALNEEFQNLMEQYECLEKKKSNLDKLYHQINNENGQLQELKLKMEKELCELQNQNLLLKEKIMSTTASSEDAQALRNKVKELTMKVKTFEKKIIPDLEQEIAEKNCCIQNMNEEIREANITSQRMRNEALRVIQHTKKYLAAQRCANETLKSRLECSNKRGNLLGAENRELEEQLKAVSRMNEFLLCQLENSKSDVETEQRSCSPLPWGCATVERDTSSSEYLAESGIQSMQQSPTNADYTGYEFKQESKRSNSQWNSLKRHKHGGSADNPMCSGRTLNNSYR